MPKPEKVEANIRSWLREERNDTLTAFTRVVTLSMSTTGTTVSGSVSVADLRIPAEALGRDPSDMWNVPGSTRALALSPGTFRVLRLGGFKERVKAVEVEEPLDSVVVHHLDHESSSGHRIRYFVLDLPDGRWMADSHIHVKKNGQPSPFARSSDALIAALGPRTIAIS